ncbi:MAG: tyrosine-type recombinase/integrase [Candidatus Dormibacteria bacterium]
MAGKRANGTGSVGQRADGRWWARYTARDHDGHAIRRVVYGRTRREAEDKLIGLLRDRNLALVAARRGRGVTVAEYAERWLTTRAAGLRPATARSYGELIRHHVIPALGRVPLARLEIAQVNDLLGAKLAAGLAPRTVHHVRAVLRTMLNAALREGLTPRNVAALADPPRVPQVERVTLTPEQAQRLVEVAHQERDGALWVLALTTGARQGELLALRWPDYDQGSGVVRIAHNLQRVAGELVLAETKTALSRRTVVLPAAARDALARQRSTQAADQLRAGRTWANELGLIFTTPAGRPRDGTVISHQFRLRCRALGLPSMTFHDLRHSAASLLAVAGVQPRDVQAQLGHSNVLTTLQTYTHVATGSGALIAGVMDTILAGNARGSG